MCLNQSRLEVGCRQGEGGPIIWNKLSSQGRSSSVAQTCGAPAVASSLKGRPLVQLAWASVQDLGCHKEVVQDRLPTHTVLLLLLEEFRVGDLPTLPSVKWYSLVVPPKSG